MQNHLKTRMVALILLSAGYGWAGGHYIPADSPVVAYLFQFVVIGFLLIAGSDFLSMSAAGLQTRRWPVRAISIFSVLSLLINIANIVHGVVNVDPHGFGSHNSFADLVPIAIIIIGSVLWISTVLKQAGTRSQTSG
jgi:hypothetical protein